jgi:class 3 adenylate cyclase/tetratricopeptide (TPR) repeat protein
MICPNCGSINPENARFCNTCGQQLELAPRICAVCGTANPHNARFCNQCGSLLSDTAPTIASADTATNTKSPTSPNTPGVQTVTTVVTTTTADGADSPVISTISALAGEDDEGAEEHGEQRRVVTVLFADLTSSTTLADGMDAEDVRALLAGFFTTMAREIHRHGGTVEKYIGDAVMAVFGLPVAHEDDPVRAVRAALDMQAALRSFNEERRAQDGPAPELQMRIGVNTGEVVAASGAAEGRDFLITGDPVNVAARLQQSAMPGTILVGPRTYRGTTGAVVYRALPPMDVRGKPRPVRVWEALAMVDQGEAPVPRPRGVQGQRTPLVGREVELNLLESLYSRVVRERRPHLVTIVGVPGIGKTRLAREFISSVRETAEAEDEPLPLVLDGRCPQYGEAITYWPLAEMLRALCDFTALDPTMTAREKLLAKVRETLAAAGRSDDPEVLAAYLGYTIGIETAGRRQALLPNESQQLQDGLQRAWRVFIESLAANRPLLMLVDDIHWGDDIFLDLLEYIATRASGVPLLLICPARPELLEKRPDWGGGKRNYVMIGLEALSADDAEKLVRALLPGDDVPESLRQSMLEKAEGNPFYVEEIIRMLVDRGILITGDANTCWRVAPAWEGSQEVSDPAIPDTVQGVLAARLDLLSERERDVLQHAAVLGRYFWPQALRSLHAHLNPYLTETLASLERKGMIHESERAEATVAPANDPIYSFNHALTREVTYAAIPRARRAHEHEQVAEWLEGVAQGREAEFADLIAQHYRQYYVQANLARSRNTARRLAIRAKVVHYLALAGEQAAARHAAQKAEHYYTDALGLLEEDALAEDVPLRVELLMKRGEAHWAQLQGDDAWADYREALRLWSAFSTFLVDSVAGKDGTDGVEEHFSAPVAAEGSEEVIGELTLDEHMPLALPPQWPSWGLRLYRLLVLLPTRNGAWFQQAPSHEELLQYLQEGLRLLEELGQHDTLDGAALLTAKSFFWWSWGEKRGERELLDALQSAREAVRITDELDDPAGASEALDALGNLQSITNDLRGNLESQSRRLHWARRLDDLHELVDIHSEVGNAYTLVGEFAKAIEQEEMALGLAESAETEEMTTRALRALLVTYFEWDHWQDAINIGQKLAAYTNPPNIMHSNLHRWALLSWAIAHTRRGERDEADRLVKRISMVADRNEVLLIEFMKGRLALARGATKEARQLFLSGYEARTGRTLLPMLLAELAELGARTGDMELYERFGAQALELGWRSGARKAQAQATRARGIVAVAENRWDDALADLESALNRYRALGTPWEEARTRYALAGLYQRRGDEDDLARAREQLTLALALYEPLHAVRDIARARAALAGADVRLPAGKVSG